MLLKVGSKGEDVKKLQEKLGTTADGDFGPGTEKLVKEWQAANGLTADGLVGDGTWAKMFGSAPVAAPVVSGTLKLEKLKNFARVGIEISIESTTVHNDYVRQGTNTAEVLENIARYQEFCNGTNISLTLRPAISALTVGYYHTVIDYCLTNKLLIKSLLCSVQIKGKESSLNSSQSGNK